MKYQFKVILAFLAVSLSLVSLYARATSSAQQTGVGANPLPIVNGGTAVTTIAAVAAELPLFTSTLQGLVPPSGTVTFAASLRADGTWGTQGSTMWSTSGANIYFSSGNVGIGTTSPTSLLTLNGTGAANGINLGNDYIYGNSGSGIIIGSSTNGTTITLQASNGTIYASSIQASSWSTPANNVGMKFINRIFDNSSGTQIPYQIVPTINQSGTAGFSTLRVTPYLQALGSGTNLLLDVGTNTAANGNGTHSPLFVVNSSGNVGIGITLPASILHVDGGTATASQLKFTAGTTTGTASNNGVNFGVDASGNALVKQYGALDTIFLTNNAEVARLKSAGNFVFPTTTTTPGTTGNQTINKISGTVNIAAAGTAVTVTNSLVAATSLVFAVVRTSDTTAYVKHVVPASGSFVITLGAAAGAEVSIGFFVIN